MISLVIMQLAVGTAMDAHALVAPVFSHQMNISSHVSGPARVTTGTGGNIYIADEEAKTVTVLDQYGNKLFVIGGSYIPRSVAVDTQQRIYVGYKTDEQLGYVSVFDPSGQFLRYLGSGPGDFGLPGDIAVSLGTGKVYVLDSIQNMVKVYDSGGNRVVDSNGNPFHVGGFGQYDGYNAASNPGKFDFPSGIAVDDIRQEVLVSDQNNYRVQIFDMNGAFKTAFGKHAPDTSWSFGNPHHDLRGKFSSIRGLVVDKEGRIYVADAFQGSVQVLDRTGAHLTFIGQQGDGTGQLDVPVDVTIDTHKRLIIADWNNNRLSIFKIDSGPSINNMAPTVPVQMSPAHATQVNGVSPSLTVQNAIDPNGDLLLYLFQVDTSPSFANPVSFTAAEGSAYTSGITPTLTDHTLYFWRARAEEAATPEMYTSAWTGSQSFYINALNRPPTAPSALFPVAGSSVRKSTSLGWAASADPDLYDTFTYAVEISEKANFSSILLSQAGLGNTNMRIDTMSQYTFLKSGNTYYWRVRAVDSHGASSAYSSASSFVFSQTILSITSNPGGAKVYLGGNYAYRGTYKGVTGATPVDIVDIDPGRHVLRVEKAGYFGYYTSVLVTQGETRAVEANLSADRSGSRPFKVKMADNTGAVIGDGIPALRLVKPFMVDWDNDGRKDLLTGDEGGRIYLFENISSDASPVFRLSLDYPEGVALTVSARAIPVVIDWNGDSRKDLIVGCGDGTVRLYLNQGSDSSPQLTSFSNISANGAAIQTSGNAAPFVVDWNSDGKKDLMVGESVGNVRIFINTGTDDAPAFNDVAETVQGAYLQAAGSVIGVTADAVPFVTDWNNDGNKDLLLGSNADVKIFLNTVSDQAPLLSAASSYITGTGLAPFVLDHNGDAFSDMLIGDGDGNVSYYQFKGDVPPAETPAVKKKKKNSSSNGFKKLFRW